MLEVMDSFNFQGHLVAVLMYLVLDVAAMRKKLKRLLAPVVAIELDCIPSPKRA
jgi:hypothetical protein